ncbi:MAG: tRNA uridine-5-carboxymethylaminomethyl(34) synthesis GTPase MnmE [Halofilum sp. (in: g-proteobacteria)]
MPDATADTIAAVATPPGHGGVGVIRVSGPVAATIGQAVAGPLPAPRQAGFRSFRDAAGEPLDQGLVLWFPAPASYTGEDTLELHGHGGPAVLDAVLARVLGLGARAARAGEFTERAFLNGRLDLAQAEAVADLIETADAAGARAAMRSLAGDFSVRIEALVDELTALRAWIEAALDFPDDEVDFLADDALHARLSALQDSVAETRATAAEGRRLVEGATVAIVGAPNAGKSSLLNRLAATDAAIVTEIPGTTRDTLRENVRIEGVPLTVIDTAGLRETDDPVESEGVRRARDAIARADRVLHIIDGSTASFEELAVPPNVPVTLVRNKVDLTGERPGAGSDPKTGADCFAVSATTGAGLDALRTHLGRTLAGGAESGGAFSARRRHLEALDRTTEYVRAAVDELTIRAAGELAAEQLRHAQEALGEITGRVTTEDLLGEIFGRFCIGK